MCSSSSAAAAFTITMFMCHQQHRVAYSSTETTTAETCVRSLVTLKYTARGNQNHLGWLFGGNLKSGGVNQLNLHSTDFLFSQNKSQKLERGLLFHRDILSDRTAQVCAYGNKACVDCF